MIAFYNVLDNALKFSANGAIELRAAEDGRMAVVEIADAALGIPDAWDFWVTRLSEMTGQYW